MISGECHAHESRSLVGRQTRADATEFLGTLHFVVMIVKALGILLLHSIRYLFNMVCPRSTKWETSVSSTYVRILSVLNEPRWEEEEEEKFDAYAESL